MLEAADQCIAYFVHTAYNGIAFDGSRGGDLVAYSDSDWSKRQQCIALSSTEAEVMAASAAATEVAYMREIFRDLGLCQSAATELYVDNTGAEMLAKERKVTSRSRHITRRFLKVREYMADGILVVRRVATDDNTADIFTKPLVGPAFRRHRDTPFGA
jgi:hypothetical protein